ncbi:rhodanese-like domain-containing protein [Rhodopseudomonas sp. B29]|uniref:rhodanese-like domain-containing protein n=1 Tax=Rhodopseudomonas sp. B29 TaxID=95607 RepID=UPI00034DEEF6|nr:rhodanese-like domain-containing protein [Rhodopseudomonas sp. B29]
MATTLKSMIEAASAEVPKITATQARELIDRGALVIDVRDAPEVESSGKIAGAIHISRGMLEFRADPGSPFHDKHLDKERTLIVYCASGGRAALAGKTLKVLGYDKVFNLGGFKEWAESGGAVETPIDRGM